LAAGKSHKKNSLGFFSFRLKNAKPKRKIMKILPALLSGLAGASALTLLHQTIRKITPDAPRMDVLGMRAIAKGFRQAGEEPPAKEELYREAMVGDMVANTLYYSFAGTGPWALVRGTLLGLTAGVGAVALPGPLGLGTRPSARNPRTAAMAVGIYLIGGVVAGAVARALPA
jgi:hypothetical protein